MSLWIDELHFELTCQIKNLCFNHQTKWSMHVIWSCVNRNIFQFMSLVNCFKDIFSYQHCPVKMKLLLTLTGICMWYEEMLYFMLFYHTVPLTVKQKDTSWLKLGQTKVLLSNTKCRWPTHVQVMWLAVRLQPEAWVIVNTPQWDLLPQAISHLDKHCLYATLPGHDTLVSTISPPSHTAPALIYS